MAWEFLRRIFNTERDDTLLQEPNPNQGNVDLSAFEGEPENRVVDSVNAGLNGVLGVGYGLDDGSNYSEDVKALIKKYREMSLVADINDAVDEIVNECIIKSQGQIINIGLEDTELSDNIKETIINEFNHLYTVTDFQYKGDEYFRQWYIDGRLYTQNLFNPEERREGIVSFNVLSPFNLERIKTTEGKQFYIYKVDRNTQMFSTAYQFRYNGFIIPDDHINFTSSGLKDANENYYISHLHKAIIPHNQLKLLEDGAVIYTMTRAVERRHFIVKTGKLNQAKSEAQVKKAMNAFKNRVVYDRSSGSISQRKDVMTITEDFWSAASDDGRGIDINPIQGGTQLRDLVDNMEYYKRNMLRSLKVPYGRFDISGATTINFGDNAKEITRDELRFTKFTNSLKDKFGRGLFLPMLRKHLYLKGIMDLEEFDNIAPDIVFHWAKDQYFEEIAKQERIRAKIEILGSVDQYIGKDKYFSKGYAYREVLGMTEEEIKEMRDEIDMEEKMGVKGDDGVEDQDDMGFGDVPEDGAIPMDDEFEEPVEEPEPEAEEEPEPESPTDSEETEEL
jgi:hypothetical protein